MTSDLIQTKFVYGEQLEPIRVELKLNHIKKFKNTSSE